MKNRRLLIGLLLTTLCVTGCQEPVNSSNNSSTNDVSVTDSNTSTTSSPSEEVVDYGTLTVKDMVAYVGNRPKAIEFTFFCIFRTIYSRQSTKQMQKPYRAVHRQ